MNTTSNDCSESKVAIAHTCEITRELHNLLTLVTPIQKFLWQPQVIHRRYFQTSGLVEKRPGKSKKAPKAAQHAEKGEAFSSSPHSHSPSTGWSEADDAWRLLVRDALKTHYWMGKAARTAKSVLNLLRALGVNPASEQYASLITGDWQTHPKRAQLLRHLARYRIDPLILEALDHRLRDTQGNWSEIVGADTLAGAVTAMERATRHFGDYVRDRVLPAHDPEARRRVLAEMTPKHHSDITINCNELPDPLKTICVIIGIIIIVIAIIATIVTIFDSLIDWMEDDDRARDEVNSAACSDLRELSNRDLARLINRMLDGATLDDDERAILRILECLPCERVTDIVQDVGRGRLLDDFHGAEWDRLMIRFQECGLADFGDWDDDATRRFIREVDCATIDSLTLDEIRQLMLNLFEGDTGDADEQAIITVVDCLDCDKRRRLVEMRGMSVEDFDDEVDGEEWDRLERRFRDCDII